MNIVLNSRVTIYPGVILNARTPLPTGLTNNNPSTSAWQRTAWVSNPW